MKTPFFARPLILILGLGLSARSQAVDVIKTWTGSANQALNNVSNWVGGTRPTFPADANTDALLFTGSGTGVINTNVDATAKSITISGPLSYRFQGASPIRLGDTTTGTVQPNTGFFVNNSAANLEITTTGGLFFSFGQLNAATNTISVGANTPIDIGNGAATVGRNLTITGGSTVTLSAPITGLGNQLSEGGHLIKDGSNTLLLNGNSAAWDGRVFINSGVVRINRGTSLGSAVGDTTIAGADSTARLELTNSIALDERLIIAGRTDPLAPVLVNVSGNNIISTPLLINSGGTEISLNSTAGTLTLGSDLDYGTLTAPATLHLTGDGDGSILGAVGAGGDPLSIRKIGLGVWTLSGANAFTGSVQVDAGRLNLSTAHVGNNALAVVTGATLGITVSEAGQSLNASSVNLAGATGTTLAFDLGSLGNPSVPVLNASSLTVTGVVGVSLKASGLSIGQIPLIDYQGSLQGEGFSAFALTSLPARVSANLVDDAANTRVLLNITGFDVPRWTGEVDANWDFNDGTGNGTTNWKELNSGGLTRYLQGPSGIDAVIFDDTAVGSTTVTLAAALTPASITVDNVSKDYAFTGTGSLEGTGSLVKRGTGKLTFLNSTANTFSGLVTIEAGTIQVGDGINGSAGSLGVGPILNQGTLILNRPDAYTLPGAISGAGAIIKVGAGTTTLSGNSDFTSIVNVNEGTLRLGNARALGDTTNGVLVANGAALDLGGQLLAEGEVVTVIGNGIADSGALVNTGAGGAAVGLKKLIFTGPGSIGGSARWDIRNQPGGVDVNGHTLIKIGSNAVYWANVGETEIADLIIRGTNSRLTFEGDSTLGSLAGTIRIEPGAQLGFEDSTVNHTKPIFVESGTINTTGGTTNTLASTVTITDNVTFNVAAASEIVVSSKLTGTGNLTKTTGGILKITSDANDYTGTTTNSAGPLWVGNDTPTGKLPAGDIINNGNLITRRTTPITYTQNISGTGQLTFGNANTGSNEQTFTLSGNNSFAGAVTLARGSLIITNSSALGTGTKVVAIQSNRQPSLVLDGTAGPITLDAAFTLNTSSETAGAIINLAGDNVINSLVNLRNGGGGNTRIRSVGGSLLIAGNLIAAPDATSARTLFLDGETLENVISGQLLNGVGNPAAVPPVAAQNLVLNKQGSGRWTLLNTNTYLGNTTVSAGTLKLGPVASIATSPAIDVLAGATLDVSEVTGGFTVANNQFLRGYGTVLGNTSLGAGSTISPGTGALAGTLTFAQNLTLNGGRVLINLTTDTTAGSGINDLVEVGGDLSITAPTAIELSAPGTLLNGFYRLFNYTGALTGDLGTLSFVNPTRYVLSLDTATPGQVNLQVAGNVASLVWSGNGTTNVWDNVTPNSWNAGAETFFQTDAVTFDDSAPNANTTVTLTGALTPSSVIVNAAQNFTFSGTGNLGGSTALTKSGTGVLTINTVNGYTGKTWITEGSIVLGITGRLNQTRWIEIDQGAVLDVQAIVAGFTLGGIADQRILSGRGTLLGNSIVNNAGVIRPGASSLPTNSTSAGDGLGALSFGGNLTLAGNAAIGAPRLILQLAGPTGQVSNPLDVPTVEAFGSTVPTQHDYLSITGTLALDAGSSIRVELASGYVPALGDVFNLADWATLNANADAAGAGYDPQLATDLELPALPSGLFWNRSLFTALGLLYISPEPPVVGTIQFEPSDTVNPGTQVTLSASVSGLEPYFYQWRKNNEDLVNQRQSTLVLSATEADQGVYTLVVSNPAGPTTSVSATLTVNDPIQFTAQPQNVTVNPNGSASFSVSVTGTADFGYQWFRGDAEIPGAQGSTLNLTSITEADQGLYRVRVTNIVGTATSEAASLSVNDPVVIVTPPQPQGALVGGSATFTVAVTGTGPFSYRWIKNGVDIPGAAASLASLTLTDLIEEDEALFSVRVTNTVGSQTSSSAALVVAGDDPKVVTQSSSQIVSLGTATLNLNVNAVGLPPLKYQWFKGAAKVAGATTAQLQLRNVQLKDAAAYRVEVVSGINSPVSSQLIQVAVVDITAGAIVLVGGGTTKLDVKAEGNSLTYVWKKDEVAVTATDRVTGVNSKILTIGKPLGDEDSGLYKLVVNGPGGSLTTLGHDVRIFTEPPVITEDPPLFPAAIIGGDFIYQTPLDPAPRKTPTAFAVTGLPPGLKLDVKTGRITGKPTAITKDVLGYLVKITASNSKGKSVVSGRLKVQSVPAGAVGVFAGPIGRQTILNAGLGGLLELTVANTAAFSGKLVLGTLSYPLKGALVITPEVDATPVTLNATQVIVRKGLPNLTLTFTIDALNNRLSAAQLTDGTAVIQFAAWRNKWSKTVSATTGYGTYHTFALEIPTGLVSTPNTPRPDVPQGNGFGSFTIAPDGKLSITGKLADGEALTSATFLGPQGEIALFRTLYLTKEKGSVAGRLNVTSPDLTGTLTWSRPPNPAATHRLYKAGFPQVIDLSAFGGRYAAPISPLVFLNLEANDVARLSLRDAGLESSVTVLTDLDLSVTLQAKSKAVLPVNATANPRKPTLTLTEKTGVIKGGFALENSNPLPSGKPPIIKRTVTFEGITVRDGGSLRSYGFFLLPQLPSVATPVTTPILSGQVIFEEPTLP